MKVSYSKEEDILMVEVARGKLDHAEEMGSLIVHFDKRGHPLLLEILDASHFLQTAARRIGPKALSTV